MNLLSYFRILALIPGFHTNKKIIVIESDDWGTIRTKNKYSLKYLAKKYPQILDDPYNRFDSLECNDDLTLLLEILTSFKDKNGNHPKITANTIVANPDFEKTKNEMFSCYHYEKVENTYKKYPNCDNVLNIVKQGMLSGVFKPQLHGREHINISQWIKALKNGNQELVDAFEHDMFGVSLNESVNNRHNVMAAFDIDDELDIEKQKKILEEAQSIFQELYGFKSQTFIAPCYIWHPALEYEISRIGVKGIQGIAFQFIPKQNKLYYKRKFRYTGGKTTSGLINLTRNVFFEPTIFPQKDNVSECLYRINQTFMMRKPVIIGSHRVNYMGSLDENNRDKNLKALKLLLKQIVTIWPDVNFLDSEQLCNLILDRRKNSHP